MKIVRSNDRIAAMLLHLEKIFVVVAVMMNTTAVPGRASSDGRASSAFSGHLNPCAQEFTPGPCAVATTTTNILFLRHKCTTLCFTNGRCVFDSY